MGLEVWRSTLAAAHASAGPADVLAAPLLHLATTGAVLSREPVARFLRRNPRREVASTYPLFSDHRLRYEFEVGSNLDPLLLALASLGDSRSTDSLFQFGGVSEPARRHFISESVDGQHLELRDAACQSLVVTVEARTAVKATAIWPGWELSTATTDDAAPAASGRGVGHSGAAVTIGAETAPVFFASLDISRDIKPAAYDGDGNAHAWAGSKAVDIVGKMTVRASATWLDAAILNARTDDITLAIALPDGRNVTFTITAAVFQARGKIWIGKDLWEWPVEFVAAAEGEEIGSVSVT